MNFFVPILVFTFFLLSCEKSPSDVCFSEEVINSVKSQIAAETSQLIIQSVVTGSIFGMVFAQNDNNMEKINKLFEGDTQSVLERLGKLQEKMYNQIYKDSKLVDRLTSEKVNRTSYKCNAIFNVVIEIPKEINTSSDKSEKVESLFRVKYEVEYLEGSKAGVYYKVKVSDIEEIKS